MIVCLMAGAKPWKDGAFDRGTSMPWSAFALSAAVFTAIASEFLRGAEYRVYGHKGKQVRDNIHSFDVIQAFEAFRQAPRPGEVYNLGGGRENSVSILEAFELIERLTGRKTRWKYIETCRMGDHVCYITDLRKLKNHFPRWRVTRSLEDIFQEMLNRASSYGKYDSGRVHAH